MSNDKKYHTNTLGWFTRLVHLYIESCSEVLL